MQDLRRKQKRVNRLSGIYKYVGLLAPLTRKDKELNKDRLNINLEEIKDRVTWVHENLDKYKGWIPDTNIKYGLELMREELTEINIKLFKIQQGTDPIKEREQKIKEYTELAR